MGKRPPGTSRRGSPDGELVDADPGLDPDALFDGWPSRLTLFRTVANRLELESMRIKPVGRKTVFAILREVAWFVQDDGLACTCPLVCFSDDRSGRDQECEVMKARLAARVGSRFFCLVEEQL